MTKGELLKAIESLSVNDEVKVIVLNEGTVFAREVLKVATSKLHRGGDVDDLDVIALTTE